MADRVTPIPTLIAATIAACFSFGAIFLTVPYMARPVLDMTGRDFLVAVTSDQTGGSLWVTVESAQPIDLRLQRDVQLTITVASSEDVQPLLILGGGAATAIRSCEGLGAYIDPAATQVTFDELPKAAQKLVTEFAREAPSTGEVGYYSSTDKLPAPAASEAMSTWTYRTEALELVQSDDRITDDEQAETRQVQVASLTCTFGWETLLMESSGNVGFITPDVIAGADHLEGEGPIRVDYTFQVANNSGFTRTASTFTSATEFIDADTANRLVSFTGDWSTDRNPTGDRAILISGGYVSSSPGTLRKSVSAPSCSPRSSRR